MGRMFRRLFALAVFCAAFLLTQFAGQTPVVHADTIPPLQWNQASLGDMRPTTVVTSPDGGAVVGCDAYATNSFVAFASNGSNASVANDAHFSPQVCTGMTAVDKNSVVYTKADTDNGPVLAAYNGNTLKWTYPLSCGGQVSSIVIGANDKIYFVLASGFGCGQAKLVGVEPELQSGQAIPATVFNVPIYGIASSAELAAYDDGLLVRLSNGIAHFNYDGNEANTEVGPVPLAPHYGRQFSVTTDGRAFVPVLADQPVRTVCNDSSVVSGIAAYDPNHSNAAWAFTDLPQCSEVYDLHATYHGGVLAHILAPAGGISGNDLQDKILMIQGGVLLWSMTMPASEPDGSVFTARSFEVDLNGNVVWQSEAHIPATINGTVKYFPAVEIGLLSGWTGTPLAHVELAGDNQNYGYQASNRDNYQIAIARDTVYVPVRQCASIASCSGGANLFAIKLPGVTMDYPRGAILDHDQPWLDYVAMGDSFASGEGAPPFLTGTDVDGAVPNHCHRSENAYAKLLDGNPNLKTHLAHFVACSGAKIAQITGTWPDDVAKPDNLEEDPQIEALDSNTKVVTLSIGGNDIGFADFVAKCLFADCAVIKQDYLDKVASLGDALNNAYNMILQQAPNATIYVVGYPEILPSDNDCTYSSTQQWGLEWVTRAFSAASTVGPLREAVRSFLIERGLTPTEADDVIANGGSVQLSQDEIQAAQELVTALDGKIRATVGTVRPRLKYIDPQAAGSPFGGHPLCSANEYFNGVDLDNPEYSFHPNQKGVYAFLNLVSSSLS